MSKMYIANTTKQDHVFTYRVPDDESATMSRPRAITIRAAAQVALPDNMNTPQIDAIIQQHGRYGMVDAKEIDRTKPFIGLCYSIDRPVSLDTIRHGLGHNDKVLVERGRKMREEAGVAAFQQAEQNMFELSQQSGEQMGLGAMEVEIVEQNHEKFNGVREGDPVAEGVRISPHEDPVSTPRRGRPRKNG